MVQWIHLVREEGYVKLRHLRTYIHDVTTKKTVTFNTFIYITGERWKWRN